MMNACLNGGIVYSLTPMFVTVLATISVSVVGGVTGTHRPPHKVFIMADDIGKLYNT
jgi:hypothetical protein